MADITSNIDILEINFFRLPIDLRHGLFQLWSVPNQHQYPTTAGYELPILLLGGAVKREDTRV